MVCHQRIGALVVALCALLMPLACDNGGGSGTPDAGGDREVLNETCPADCESAPRCTGGRIESCCACVDVPSEEAARCGPSECDEYAGSGSVDLSCFADDPWSGEVPDPQLVRLVGVVDVYATGGDSTDGIHVEVYQMNDDASLGSLIGQYVTSVDEAPCDDETRQAQLERFLVESGDEAEHCPGICREEIPDTGGDCRRLGYYTIDDVLTSTPLVIVTYAESLWRHLYAYNVMFFEDDIEELELDGVTGPTVFYKVRVLSNGDWSAIPTVAGLPSGIPESHGAVAGEIHDCGDIRIRNVQVGINPAPVHFTYFNGNESKPYPDAFRSVGTDTLGLFAGLDIDPADNPVYVSAVGLVDGELVSLGWAVARVFPGSVTIMTLRGTRPGIDEF